MGHDCLCAWICLAATITKADGRGLMAVVSGARRDGIDDLFELSSCRRLLISKGNYQRKTCAGINSSIEKLVWSLAWPTRNT
jgi:hypothetical protein